MVSKLWEKIQNSDALLQCLKAHKPKINVRIQIYCSSKKQKHKQNKSKIYLTELKVRTRQDFGM